MRKTATTLVCLFFLAAVFVCALKASAGRDTLPLLAPLPAITPTPPPIIRLPLIVLGDKNRPVWDVRRDELSVNLDGAPQTIVEFSGEESEVSYGIVVDNSGSVRPILDYIVRASGALVRATRPGDELFIQRFATASRIEILQDFTQDQVALEDALSSMYIEGGQTAVVDAIYAAVEHVVKRNAAAPKRPALVVFTDGEERGSRRNKEQLLQLLRESEVQVFVIGLTNLLDNEGGFIKKSPREQATRLLEEIAAESGGRAFFPKIGRGRNNPAELGMAVTDVINHLQKQYVLSVTVPHEADGKLHKVQVRIADVPGRGKRRVIARTSYFARKA